MSAFSERGEYAFLLTLICAAGEQGHTKRGRYTHRRIADDVRDIEADTARTFGHEPALAANVDERAWRDLR